MNTDLLLLIELLISTGICLLVLRVLANSLIKILERICPDKESAGFWLTYTKVMLVIAPMILVLMVDLFSRYSTPQDSFRGALLATLAGLLIGLRQLGSRLGKFIAIPEQTPKGSRQ